LHLTCERRWDETGKRAANTSPRYSASIGLSFALAASNSAEEDGARFGFADMSPTATVHRTK
jgi:hypothetical protein